MKLANILVATCLFALIAGCGGSGDSATVPQAKPAGETSTDIGDYVVYFNAQSTDQLTPEIAGAYGIVRSKSRVMLNVSIVRKSDDLPVAGNVTVKTSNLTGQLKNVTMRKIEEPGETTAIYYIGETPVANRETLIFDIRVIPDGEREAAEVRFKREFFTDY